MSSGCRSTGFEQEAGVQGGGASGAQDAFLGDGSHHGVGEDPERGRRNREDRSVDPGRSPNHLEGAEIGVHHDPSLTAVAERRDPTNGEAGQFVGFASGSPTNRQFAGYRGESGNVHAIAARNETDDGCEPAVGTWGDEHERLDDLIEPDPCSRSCLLGSSRRRLKDCDFEPDAFAQGCVDYALYSWV